MDKNKNFQELFKSYKLAYPEKQPQMLQKKAVEFWNSVKSDSDFQQKLEDKFKQLYSESLQRKQKTFSFWTKFSQMQPHNLESPSTSKRDDDDRAEPPEIHLKEPESKVGENVGKRKTPAQFELSRKIFILECDINALNLKKNANLLSSEECEELKTKNIELSRARQHMIALKKGQERASKSRLELKRKMMNFIHENPGEEGKFNSRGKKGRPPLEESQPDLLKTIINIATYGSKADSRRRTEMINSVKTLDELTRVLQTEFGYHISRSAVYLRLLPRRVDSNEGKQHIRTVPVKLVKAQNAAHKEHSDSKFATATIRNLETLASILGPNETFFLSQDDKARVPIGITAAHKQSPLLMHMEYRVTLPDHDWVVAPSHKLIPSVYAGIKIEHNRIGYQDAVSYSGPTYIAIRSAKHSSSTALTHAMDIEKVFDIPEFNSLVRDSKGANKPVCIITVDGGPDENPRYMKVIQTAIHHFVKNDFDALFVACNAPGRSAFNRVERRMAPLSKELSGVILPYDHFGRHLNSQGVTIDDELEKKNFAHAGSALAEIWSQTEIDHFPVVSEYIDPDNANIDMIDLQEKDLSWQKNHVRSSQYLLQIVKCQDERCCRAFRSSILKICPQRFLPPPLQVTQNEDGLSISDKTGHFAPLFLLQTLLMTFKNDECFKNFNEIPYDHCCPSVRPDVQKKICKKCGIYFGSLTYLRNHQKHCKVSIPSQKVRPVRIVAKRQRELLAIIRNIENDEDAEWLEEDEVDIEKLTIPEFKDEKKPAPFFTIEEHLRLSWE